MPPLMEGRPILRIGSTGDAVRELQALLTGWGWALVQDGVYGPITEQAVRAYQASQGLTPDGVVGPATWARLVSEPSIWPAPGSAASGDDEHEARMRTAISGLSAQPESHWALRLKVVQRAGICVGRREAPDGSNDGLQIHKFIGGYGEYWRIKDYKPAPWCGMFASWAVGSVLAGVYADTAASAIRWADTPLRHWLGGVWGGIGSWEHRAKEAGWLRDDPARGAVLLMGRSPSGSDAGGGGHCGIVAYEADGYVTSIDGNVGNAVGWRVRPRKDIQKYVWWWEG